MKKIFLLFFSLLVFNFDFPAQVSQSEPNSDQDVVKISTNLIQIDVTVTDKKGNIIKGLKPEEFEIFENGEKQEITGFSFVSVKEAEAQAKGGEKNDKNSPPPPPMQPAKLRAEQTRRTIAIVVDDIAMSFAGIFDTKTALHRFIDKQMDEGDIVAILRTGAYAGILQQFTNDKRILHAAVSKLKWNQRAKQGLFNSLEPTAEQEFAAIGANPAPAIKPEDASPFESGRIGQFGATIGFMKNVVAGMQQLPGRKAIMFFSDGFIPINSLAGASSLSKQDFETDVLIPLRLLIDSAVRSSVVIYTIDTRGLIFPGITAEDNLIGEGLNLGADDLTAQTLANRQEQITIGQQGLDLLAYQTGGIPIRNQNFFDSGMARIMRDQLGYYLLAYQPDGDTFDPAKRRFNKLTVKLKGRDDLQVRYRSGFFAISDEERKESVSKSKKDPQSQLLASLTMPFAKSDLNLRLTPLFVNDSTTGLTIKSFVRLPVEELKIIKETNGWYIVRFLVAAIIYGADGSILDGASRNETMRMKEEIYQEILKSGFVYTLNLPVKKPGAYQLRVAIRDSETMKIGAAGQYIEVPNLKKGKLSLSSLLLENFSAEEAKNGKLKARSRLQSDLQIDTSERKFNKGGFLRYQFDLYNAKSGAQLSLQSILFKDGKKVAADQPKNISGDSASGLIKLPANLAPGDYMLQAVVRDPAKKGRDGFAAQSIDFEILP